MPDVPVSAALERALASARALGFLGPGALEDHIRSSLAFLHAVQEVGAGGPALDLGSGGGIPGLPLAEWTSLHWTLFDAHRRRCSFLLAQIEPLGLVGRVVVHRGRAETEAHVPGMRASFGLVTARSFAPPAATAEAAAGFLAQGGWLLVAEPPEQESDRWPPEGIARLGLTKREVVEFSQGSGIRRLAAFQRTGEIPPEIPRRIERQRQRPLW